MLQDERANQALISELFDTQPDSVVWFIPVFSNGQSAEHLVSDFHPKYCNTAACKILGSEKSKVLEQPLLRSPLLDEVSRSRIFEQCLQVWKTGEPIEFTYHSPGIDKYFNVQRSKVMNGILSITRDRTKEMLHEETIHEQAHLLNTILNSSLNGIYTLKAIKNTSNEIIDFEITHANAVFCKMSGKTQADVIGKSYLETFPHTKASGVFDRNRQVLVSGLAVRQELHYEGDGVDFWFDSSTTRISQDKIVISFNDISALKNTAVALTKSNEELRKSNQRLSEFTHVASHDLSEPLRKLLTYSILLNERYANSLDAAAKDYIHKITVTARRMQMLINDLLAYSEVSNGMDTNREISLAEIVKEVLNDIEVLVNESHAQVQIDDLPRIHGDQMQLRQIFQNLLTNAIKFQSQGVPPRIHVRDGGEVIRKDKCYFAVEVQDNGIGFDQSESAKIFNLFERLHNRNDYEGTGIGLAIVQQAMKNHNGLIEVNSVPGQGSCFKLLFERV